MLPWQLLMEDVLAGLGVLAGNLYPGWMTTLHSLFKVRAGPFLRATNLQILYLNFESQNMKRKN